MLQAQLVSFGFLSMSNAAAKLRDNDSEASLLYREVSLMRCGQVESREALCRSNSSYLLRLTPCHTPV
jgi:hypothetical protein